MANLTDNEVELRAMQSIMRRNGYYLDTEKKIAYYDKDTRRLTYIDWLAESLGWELKAMLDDPVGFAYAYIAESAPVPKQYTSERVRAAELRLDKLAEIEEEKKRKAAAREAAAKAHERALQRALQVYEEADDSTIVGYNLRTCPMTAKEAAYINYLKIKLL